MKMIDRAKSGAEILLSLIAASRDTGWKEAILTDKFKTYASGTVTKYRRIGNRVTLTGAVTPAETLSTIGNARHPITTLPAGYRPATDIITICQASGTGIFTCRINPSGVVTLERGRDMASENGAYDYKFADGTWAPLNITFITDNAFPAGGGGIA